MRPVAFIVLALMTPLGLAHSDDEGRGNPVDLTARTLADQEALARLQKPGEVFLTEGFEKADALAGWFNLIGKDEGRTRLRLGAGQAHSGAGALELRVVDRGGESCGAGASRWFYPGYETVYFRRYIRFAEDYDQGNRNHVGGSLYAVAGSDRWAEMGKAGVRPTGDDRFGAAFEPWRDWGRHDPPGAMMLYTYWMDMKRDRDGNFWGNMFAPAAERKVELKRGVWHCLEHMIKANTPGRADGEMAAWIDGRLYIHLKGLRWRTSPDVKLKRVGLGLYVHQSTRANTVWYDDVVASTGYIGPATGSR